MRRRTAFSLQPIRLSHTTIGIIVFISSWAVYAWTVHPTLSTGDSGELIAAAASMGVAHPPGYPLYVSMAHIMTLVPLGSMAFRTNVCSAVLTALALAGLAAWLAARGASSIGRSAGTWLAVACALSLGLTERVWSQAIETEVYALNTWIQLMLIVLVAEEIRRWGSPRPSRWPLVALVAGVGMGHHFMSWLWLPVVAGVMWTGWRRHGGMPQSSQLRWASGALALAGVGWSFAAILPLRSMTNPLMDWGNPESWSAVWGHVTRSQYGVAAGPARTVERTWWQLRELGMWLASEWSWLGMAALAGSVWFMWKRGKSRPAWVMAGWTGCVVAGILFAINPIDTPTSRYLVREFYVPLSVLAVIGIWRSLVTVVALAPGLLSACVMAGPVALGLWHWPAIRDDQDATAYWYGRNVMSVVERNGLVFAAGDKTVIPLAYLTLVEGWRHDVLICDEIGCVFGNMYGDGFLALTGGEQDIRRTLVQQALMASHPDRPTYGTEGSQMFRSATRVVSMGLVSKVDRADAGPGAAGTLALVLRRIVRPESWERVRDYIARDMVVEHDDIRTEHAVKTGRREEAQRWRRKAERMGWDIQWVQSRLARKAMEHDHNPLEAVRFAEANVRLNPYASEPHNALGQAYLDARRFEDAIQSLGRALEIEPSSVEARNNLGNAHLGAGRAEEAEQDYREALRLDPRHVRANNNLGIVLFRMERFAEAAVALEQAIALDPHYVNAHSNLGAVYYKLGKTAEATREWEQVLRLDPAHAEARQNLLAVTGTSK